jgi:hypothetical protein
MLLCVGPRRELHTTHQTLREVARRLRSSQPGIRTSKNLPSTHSGELTSERRH